MRLGMADELGQLQYALEQARAEVGRLTLENNLYKWAAADRVRKLREVCAALGIADDVEPCEAIRQLRREVAGLRTECIGRGRTAGDTEGPGSCPA